LLDVDEVWLFTSVGVRTHLAVLGRYYNIATVIATEARTLQTATDDDPATYMGVAKAEGMTPGFWKNDADNRDAVAWPHNPDGSLVWSPNQTVGSVFTAAPEPYASMTLLEALNLGGGGINALLRQAVAALLSATQPFVAYPNTPLEVVTLTNAALASGNDTQITNLKNQWDKYNNYESDLDQWGRPGATKITIADTSVTEAGAGLIAVTLTLSLTTMAFVDVTVNFATVAGSALAGSDFIAKSGQIVFAAGETVATLVVYVVADAFRETNETFRVVLSAATGATIGDNSATVTIRNDD
jgi:hypothetical protein